MVPQKINKFQQTHIPSARRSLEFWMRASWIYFRYKSVQLKALYLNKVGYSQESIEQDVWIPQHKWAGEQMFNLFVDLKGFYIKAGQFIGAKDDFFPKEVCEPLRRLQDEVPPLPAYQIEQIIREELNIKSLDLIFDFIDLNNPIGSASIAQVHRGRLKQSLKPRKGIFRIIIEKLPIVSKVYKKVHLKKFVLERDMEVWQLANELGLSIKDVLKHNKGISHSDRLSKGRCINIIDVYPDSEYQYTPQQAQQVAIQHAYTQGIVQGDGEVAIKVQYPNSYDLMVQDLSNVRSLAAILEKTDMKFDLASVVDELRDQIKLEFDFVREARVMDCIKEDLKELQSQVVIPSSIPGLVSKRVLVMTFIDGVKITQLESKMLNISESQKKIFQRKMIHTISDAYGKMILGSGLFQADAHPGNIMVTSGGKIALIDYGQSKQLNQKQQILLAHLFLSMSRNDKIGIKTALEDMGVESSQQDLDKLRTMANNMFDTKGVIDNIFGPTSQIKDAGIQTFPKDLFFVMRITQLLRALSQYMHITDFSCVRQWSPLAQNKLNSLNTCVKPYADWEGNEDKEW